jgi:hypothetical protein
MGPGHDVHEAFRSILGAGHPACVSQVFDADADRAHGGKGRADIRSLQSGPRRGGAPRMAEERD